MKRLIYLTYLSLLVLILFSCQQEQILPQTAEAAQVNSEAKIGICKPYFYTTKTGIMHLGNARGDYVLVGFNPALTLADQQKILSRYSVYDTTDGDFFMDSGLITVVKLKAGTSCTAVDNFLMLLQTRPAVQFALPVFNPLPGQEGIFEWVGLTNEFMVKLKAPNAYQHMSQMAKLTNTQIVTNLDDVTYILSANKNSAGNALEMCTVFNRSPRIVGADPNFLYQLSPFEGMRKMPKRTPQKELRKKQVASI
jgi:hypothetical protein